MKFILLGIAQFAVFSSFAQSRTSSYEWVVTKDNGGTKGFQTVEERHEGTIHTLICKDAGTKAPQWKASKYDIITTPTGDFSLSRDIEPYIKEEIAKSHTHGHVKFPRADIDLMWKAKDAGNYTYRAAIEK